MRRYAPGVVGAYRDEATEAYTLQGMAHAYIEEAFRDLGRYGSDPQAIQTRSRYLYLLAIDPTVNIKALRRSHVKLSGSSGALALEVDAACASMASDDAQNGAFRREIARYGCGGTRDRAMTTPRETSDA